MFFHLDGVGGVGVMTVYTVENNHLSICFPLFPSPLLHRLARQQCHCGGSKNINGRPKFVWPARK